MDVSNEFGANVELGVGGVEAAQRQVRSFQRWLSISDVGAPLGGEPHKLSPTLVVRSDAIALGVSSPRFAYRVYLDEGKKQFLHLRRKGILQRNLASGLAQWDWPSDISAFSEQMSKYPGATHSITLVDFDSYIEDSTIIADSVVSPSDTKWSDYHIITNRIRYLYGETSDEAERSVVFLRNFGFSGLCGPCALFMGGFLLHQHCEHLFGIAELSAFGKENLQTLAITGLNIDQLTKNAFKNLGLSVLQEYSAFGSILPEGSGLSPQDSFLLSLRSYIESGVPVIVSVCTNRLEGKGVYRRLEQDWEIVSSDVTADSYPKRQGEEKHFIVINGVKYCSSTKKYSFLALDSGSVPFLEITGEELFECSILGEEIATNYQQDMRLPPGSSEVSSFSPKKLPVMAPILPKDLPVGCRLGACRWYTPESDTFIDFEGFIARAVYLLELFFRGEGLQDEELLDLNYPGEFRLCKLSDIVHASVGTEFEEVTSTYKGDIDSDWVWLHKVGGWTFAWKASYSYQHYLTFHEACCFHGKFVFDNSLMKKVRPLNAVYDSEIEARTIGEDWSKDNWDEQEESLSDKNLTPAILTSAFCGSLEENFRALPEDAKFIELYSFFEGDIQFLFPKIQENVSILDALSSASRVEIGGAAYRVHELLRHYRKDVTIIGLATFLPELSSFSQVVRERATLALVRLTEFCEYLNDFGHKVDTVQIVAGTPVVNRGVMGWVAQEKPEETIESVGFLNFGSRGISNERLIDSLFEVHEKTRNLTIRYALEFEPGPLFTLNSIAVAEDFQRRLTSRANLYIEARESLLKRIGFNLDIGHLGFIMKDKTALLNSAVWDKVIHVHINDHATGHIGDLAIGRVHDKEDYQKWIIELLLLHGGSNAAELPYNGYISMELELANEQHYQVSWQRLKSICRNI